MPRDRGLRFAEPLLGMSWSLRWILSLVFSRNCVSCMVVRNFFFRFSSLYPSHSSFLPDISCILSFVVTYSSSFSAHFHLCPFAFSPLPYSLHHPFVTSCVMESLLHFHPHIHCSRTSKTYQRPEEKSICRLLIPTAQEQERVRENITPRMRSQTHLKRHSPSLNTDTYSQTVIYNITTIYPPTRPYFLLTELSKII